MATGHDDAQSRQPVARANKGVRNGGRPSSRTGGAAPSLHSEINITPLVDVMLVVLIIFMVVTPMLQMGIGVDLPHARHVAAATEEEDRTLTLVLQRDGHLYLGNQPIGRDDLLATLRLRHQMNPGLRFQIKADRSVPYGEIKRLMQVGREVGFRGAGLLAHEVEARAQVAAVSRVAQRED
jgi:biopolymer transport protein ExbD